MDPHRRLLTARPRAASVGRITSRGHYFYDAAGKLVIRKSITAFCLPKRAATGRKDDALRYMDWCAAEGFNEVRIFASVDWTGPPGPGVESGWTYDEDACAWVLTEARKRGLRCEVVALTYNYGKSLDAMLDMVRRVDELCLAHENALLEVANEPSRNEIDIAAILANYTPRTPGWASGQATPVPIQGQPGLSYHSPRKDEWSRCAKDAVEFYMGSGPDEPFSPGWPGFVMLDEPPQVEQTIRDAGTGAYWPDPADDWAAYGCGGAFWAAGATLHSNPTFQQCTVPTDPAILACVRGFIRGINTPPLQEYSGYSGALSPTPSDNPGSRRYQRDGADGGRYEIRVRPFGFGRV